MRIGDIAQLAGVTVRTVRHYHQIGLLPEPPRAANGYRLYGLADLIRLMRIARLKGLGLPLDRIAPLLDADHDSGDVLDTLDKDLGREIARLKAQRRTVRQLRQGATPLDMPPELAASFVALELGRSERANKAGREQAVIMAHMVRDAANPALARLFERLAAPDLAATYLALGQRFDRLGADSSEAEIDRLAADFVDQLGGWIDDYAATIATAQGDVGAVLGAHALKSTNDQQRRLSAAIGLRMARREG
jgi:DNA-binding transcriptional MerR regulator